MAITLDGSKGVILPSWTTAERPSSPVAGQLGFNSTLGYLEWYSTTSNNWTPMHQGPGYSVSYLMVAGGAGGGFNSAGGGGAGGYITSDAVFTKSVTYNVTVGGGGTAGTSSALPGNGSNTVISGTGFATLTAIGGGGGSAAAPSPGQIPQPGGSGGGGGGNQAGAKGVYPGSTYIDAFRQGYDGGVGFSDNTTYAVGGGGGGGGGAGVTAANGSAGSAGGVGIYSSISGENTAYCGGGGGGGDTRGSRAGGAGGTGGGGAGSGSASAATAGTVNTGGGGGAGPFGGGSGAAGGSGIVILSWPTTTANVASATGTYNYSESGGNRILKFTGSGTFSF